MIILGIIRWLPIDPRYAEVHSLAPESETSELGLQKLTLATYDRETASQLLKTQWLRPPAGHKTRYECLEWLKYIWAIREIEVKYLADVPQTAVILEMDQVASPQPELGPASLLMRRVAGCFRGGQLESIQAFERLGLNQSQAELTLTREVTGCLSRTLERFA